MKAIENLMLKRGKFDYILLETTGLADPGVCGMGAHRLRVAPWQWPDDGPCLRCRPHCVHVLA